METELIREEEPELLIDMLKHCAINWRLLCTISSIPFGL